MKVPDSIKSLLTASSSGERLHKIINAAPEESDVAVVVQLLAQALASSGAVEAVATRSSVKEDLMSTVDFATAASVIDDLFFLHPRGKQRLGFFSDRLVVKTSKQDVTIMAADVDDVIILDSIPKDTKNRVYIMLNFKEDAGIKNGKTKMRACVIQVTGEQQLDIQHPKDASKRLSGIAAVVICQAIGSCGITGKAAFHGSDARVFRSCTDTAAVEAFVKARAGFLFPLQNGLCFLETPPIFIRNDKIRSVDFSRANGASATFDFQVHLKNGAIEEFSNISRHELGCIQDWVDKMKLKVGFPETSDSEGAEAGASSSDTEMPSDDGSDEDFDPYKRVIKRQKAENDDDGEFTGNHPCSPADVSSSDDDDDDVELVDEEDLKVSDLDEQLKTEKETKLRDEEEAAKTQDRAAPSSNEAVQDESDLSDEDFDGEEEGSQSDSDSDGDAELVDEEDLKVTDLQKCDG